MSKDKENKPSPKTPSPKVVERTQQDPAVERGERIETGKQIARGGKSEGQVPGAAPSEKR